MAIDNITRNNTIDEWRIQTNQSASELNKLETGNYTKSNGILTLNSDSSLVITANGTSLQVSNTVLFQTRLEVGNTIALGVREAATGNLTVGNTVFIFGPGNAFFVANNATVNNNLQITNTTTTRNVVANNNITVGRNLLLTNTGNVIFANSGGANIQTIFVTDGYSRNLYTDIIEVSDYANIGANAKIGSYLDVTANVNVGTTLVVTGNTTVGNLNTSGVANSQTLKVVTSGTVGTTLVVTGNTTVGNLNTSGVANSQTLRVVTSGTIGTTLDVTGNVSAGNLNTTNTARVGSLVTTNNATVNGELLVNQNSTFNSNVGIQGTLDVIGDFTISGNVVYDTDKLIISASTPKDTGFATFGVYRTGSNAEIRWSAPSKEWQLRDVDNPTSYSKILTANLISNSIISTSSDTIASSNSANTLNKKIDALTTSNIAEGTNLYLTSTRVRNNISSTTGTAGYNSTTGVITIPGTTSHITEGANLWFTAARVRANVSNTTPINYDNSTGTFSHATSGVVATTYANNTHIPVIAVNSFGHITSVTNTAIRAATTGQTGIVQLTDSVSSTSTTTAATPNSVKSAYDLASTKLNSSGGTISGDITVTGNLVVSGQTSYVNTQTLLIGDNILTLNADLPISVAPSENSGIEVNRGNSTNVYVIWNETIDAWVANNGFSGSEFRIANTTTYLPEGNNLYFTAARVRANVSNTTPINYDNSTGTFSHATSGVVATTYANNTHIPVIAVNSFGHITSVTNTAIRAATTGQTGIVQLTDSVSSTSTTTAATPNSVKSAYDLANGKLSSITINNGTGISGGGTGSSFTLSIGQDVATTANAQFRSIGVNTAADSANAGSIRATGDVTAFFSDERLKENISVIPNALSKVNSIRGVHYTPNDVAVNYGYKKDRKVGVIAQDIEKVLPETVVAAPFDIDENGSSKSGENYKTVQYDRLVPLLIEAIKELSKEVEYLKKRL